MNSLFVGPPECRGDCSECATPVSDEVTITVAYLDQEGAEHFATIRSTESAPKIASAPGDLQFSTKTAFALMGRKVISIQMTTESAVRIHGHTPPKLRMVKG